MFRTETLFLIVLSGCSRHRELQPSRQDLTTAASSGASARAKRPAIADYDTQSDCFPRGSPLVGSRVLSDLGKRPDHTYEYRVIAWSGKDEPERALVWLHEHGASRAWELHDIGWYPTSSHPDAPSHWEHHARIDCRRTPSAVFHVPPTHENLQIFMDESGWSRPGGPGGGWVRFCPRVFEEKFRVAAPKDLLVPPWPPAQEKAPVSNAPCPPEQ